MPLRQAGAVIGLNARRNQDGVSPPLGEHLLLPGWTRRWRREPWRRSAARKDEAELHHHRHWSCRLRRCAQRQLDIDGDQRIGRIVHVPDKLLRDNRDVAVHLLGRRSHLPFHRWRPCGHAAINLPIEVLDDLGAPLLPPRGCRLHRRAVLQHERIRQRRIRVRLRLVEVRRVRCLRVAAWPAPDRRDLKQVHQPSMVLLRGQLDRRRIGGLSRGLACRQRGNAHARRDDPEEPQATAGCRSSLNESGRPRPRDRRAARTVRLRE